MGRLQTADESPVLRFLISLRQQRRGAPTIKVPLEVCGIPGGGQHWCCASSLDGSSLGTLIPGVDHLAGGPYDAGGDPGIGF